MAEIISTGSRKTQRAVPDVPDIERGSEGWTEVITARDRLLTLRLGELWRYRDLLWMFVVRDFVTMYKQTILGPIWFFIQPIFTTMTFTVIFGMIAGIQTDGIPKPLFYLSGLVCWSYFSDCLSHTATTFSGNQILFGKVYFPRIVKPISVAVSQLMKGAIQFSLFLVVYFIYMVRGVEFAPNAGLMLIPVLVVLMAILSLGIGMIISSMTTKYRDLVFLLDFGIQLWMYATPVIFPLSIVGEKYKFYLLMNPMTSIIEAFRYSFFGGSSAFRWEYLGYSAIVAIGLLLIGVIVFNRTEKNFMDTV